MQIVSRKARVVADSGEEPRTGTERGAGLGSL